MAILYSYPETLELLPEDMLIGTSTIRVAGKKKNITKNFTLELLKNFILDGNTGVQWGTITGTLSNQTDLQAALNAKQNSIILTTTGSTGPATLVGSTLNVPNYTGVSYTFTSPLINTAGIVTINQSSSTVDGYLSSIDWAMFNNKQSALSGTGLVKSTSGTISYITDNSTDWDTAYTNRITSLTTTGLGAATLIANVLNIPTPAAATFSSLTTTGSSGASTLITGVLNVPAYTLSGLGGQPLATNLTSLSGLTYAATSFVKMTAAGTFALDTNTYLTSAVTSVTATSPITSSGGNTPIISTSMATNKLIGRSTAGTGVMEEIAIGTGLSLAAGTLNATATSPLTTKGDLYTFNTDNTRLPVGLDTQVLLADSSTATGLKWGTNTAVTPTGYYGAWQDNATQTAAASNTGYAMIFRTIDLTNGVSVVTNGTNLTRITFANTGIYNLQFSSQFQNLSNSPQDVTIWLRLNGVDVSGSSGVIGLEARKNPGDPYHTVSGWNYLLNVVAGQYYELVWSTTDHTNVTMHYYPAGSPPPSAASVILTVTQQSGIMAGTGITAINSLTGAAQTLTTGTTGTDFNISSVTDTHTFNLPTASATNRGALSSADWSTFNGKFTLPSLTSGSVLFSNGTTIAQDNANFFWDDTNNRLGIGTITPTHPLNVYTTIADVGILLDSNTNPSFIIKRAGVERLKLTATGAVGTVNGLGNGLAFHTDSVERMRLNNAGRFLINTTTDNGGTVQIKAPGALSTDIALRVRNSADTANLFTVNGLQVLVKSNFVSSTVTPVSFIYSDNTNALQIIEGSGAKYVDLGGSVTQIRTSGLLQSQITGTTAAIGLSSFAFRVQGNGQTLLDEAGVNAFVTPSALLEMKATTKGFLPPRMTNAQRIAIATPAVGLMVYCTDTVEGLYINKSTGWTFII